MRTPIVAGNWKMHGNRSFVTELLTQLKADISSSMLVATIVFPPFVFLELTEQLLVNSVIAWGAQNVFYADEGAFTGEISPLMLKDFGCQYVLLGHSERRTLIGESDDLIFKKLLAVIAHGIKPILCVGETKEERESGDARSVIKKQLEQVLADQQALRALSQGAIAYEPIWAIGTGLTATPDLAQEMHAFIRQEIAKCDKNLAEKLRIIYGGSVNKNNAAALFAMPDIDGSLIGGASLKAAEFLEIVKLCH